jgi:hypothetical protein
MPWCTRCTGFLAAIGGVGALPWVFPEDAREADTLEEVDLEFGAFDMASGYGSPA